MHRYSIFLETISKYVSFNQLKNLLENYVPPQSSNITGENVRYMFDITTNGVFERGDEGNRLPLICLFVSLLLIY